MVHFFRTPGTGTTAFPSGKTTNYEYKNTPVLLGGFHPNEQEYFFCKAGIMRSFPMHIYFLYPASKTNMMQLLENSPADAAGSLDEKGNFL